MSDEPEHFEGDIDAFIEQMKADEAEGATKLTPIEYGRLRRIKPQIIYYHIRAGNIKPETCICGRKVIDVETTNEFFDNRDKEKAK